MRCGISAAAGLTVVLAGIASASDPQPTGPWQVPEAPVVIDCDLDGDGRPERIEFTSDRSESGSACCVFTLSVDGVGLRHPGIYLAGPVAVVDIDSTDRRRELVVPELGPSSDDATHFFGWSDGRLSSLGTLPGRPGVSWSPLVIDGSGQVVAHCRGQVLQTWYHPCLYRLTEEGGLEAIAEESYAMDTPLVMLDDFDVHVARDTSAATFRLRAGERIVVVGSDDRRWCEIEAADGRRGWFTVQGYSRLADGRRAEEVFAGLGNAD